MVSGKEKDNTNCREGDRRPAGQEQRAHQREAEDHGERTGISIHIHQVALEVTREKNYDIP